MRNIASKCSGKDEKASREKGKPIIFALEIIKDKKMYLKYIRQKRMCPLREVRRGTLYRVHFQPNEKGGYNETKTFIGVVYEIGSAPALIYPVGVRGRRGRLCVSFGLGVRQSVLYLIDGTARATFLEELCAALAQREEVRIEVM